MKEKNSKKYIRKVSVEFVRTKVPHKAIRSRLRCLKSPEEVPGLCQGQLHWSYDLQEAWVWKAEKDQRGNQEAH
jgi:hypothetical protein